MGLGVFENRERPLEKERISLIISMSTGTAVKCRKK
jgi:hypothetical protein